MPRRPGAKESVTVALFWDEPAEQAALGAALANDSACRLVCTELRAEDLYKEKERAILRAIQSLHARGQSVDAVTVAAELGDHEMRHYLYALADGVVVIGHTAEYVRIIRENAAKRRLKRAGEAALAELAEGNGEGAARFRQTITAALEDAAAPPPPAAPAFLDWPASWEREHSEAEWVYPDVLARGRGHALYASHKLGKSLLMLSIAAQLATGDEPVTVVYLDYEMTLDDVLERLDDMGYRGADLSRLRYALLPDLPPLDAAAGGAALMAMLDGVRAASPGHHLVLVIDTISRAAAGDENSADTYRAFYAHTGIELKRREVTWVRLDHAGKDDGAGQRGSSAKGDDIDLAWRLERSKGRLALRRDLSRMPWVPERVTFRRLEEPLRFTRLVDDYPEGTGELAEILGRLEVPLEATVREAQASLRTIGKGRRGVLIQAAMRRRREKAQGVPDTCPETPDTLPCDGSGHAPGLAPESSPDASGTHGTHAPEGLRDTPRVSTRDTVWPSPSDEASKEDESVDETAPRTMSVKAGKR